MSAKLAIKLLLALGVTSASALAVPPDRKFEVIEKSDRLVISSAGELVAEYVFGDKEILRPYSKDTKNTKEVAQMRSCFV
jgi:hypothetical protein